MKLRFSLACILLVLSAAPAAAVLSCNFSITNVAFGNVNVISGSNVDVTATVSVNCSGGSAFANARVCPSILNGTAGADANLRQMTGPTATKLNYQLYSNSARTTIWGADGDAFASSPPTINVTLNSSGTGSTTVTIFARVPSGQITVPAGSYTSSFTTAHTSFLYKQTSTENCPSLTSPLTSNPTFTVTATVTSNCIVSAVNLNFGTQGVLAANVDATTTLSVTCTQSVAYTISLNAGTGAGATVAARKMTLTGNTVTYSLYRDSARMLVWGADHRHRHGCGHRKRFGAGQHGLRPRSTADHARAGNLLRYNYSDSHLLDHTSRLCSTAAPTNEANSGCGSNGRDFSSGWNCTPMNQGCSGYSTISGNSPSGDMPEKRMPLSSSRA